jgi:2-aminoadipate transaminase
MLERGIRAASDQSLVTTGSQQALDLCGRVFADPGDLVLVEDPTYTGAITAFGNTQAHMVGVGQDAEGIDLEELDRTFTHYRREGRRVAFLYVTPNFQNPSGLLMSLERRRQLLQWATGHDVLVVEDDPYGAMYFDDLATAEETRPLKADDPSGCVVYLSTFSKTVAPGFRVAWIHARADLIDKFEIAKQSVDLCSGSLDQRVVYECWNQGVLSARLPAHRARYKEKRVAIERALKSELGDLVSWQTPKGGFFLWVAFPRSIDGDRLLERASTGGVNYVPGRAFFSDGREDCHGRLAFSGSPLERIPVAIARLAGAVREEFQACA